MKKVLFFPCAVKAHDHFIHLYHRTNTWAKRGTKHSLRAHSGMFTCHAGLPFYSLIVLNPNRQKGNFHTKWTAGKGPEKLPCFPAGRSGSENQRQHWLFPKKGWLV